MSMSLKKLGLLLTENQRGKLAAGVLLLHDMPLCTNPDCKSGRLFVSASSSS